MDRKNTSLLYTISHERGMHAQEMADGKAYPGHSSPDAVNWEKRAMVFQVQHESWEGTSKEFKQTMYDRYGRYTTILSKKEQQKYFGNYGIKLRPKDTNPMEE